MERPQNPPEKRPEAGNAGGGCVAAGAPSRQLNRDQIHPGIWNVFPTVEGDHMWLQGGLMHRHDVRDFYLDMLSMIDGLETKEGKIDIPSVL